MCFSRFLFLDQDVPSYMISGISQEDESYYSIGALQRYYNDIEKTEKKEEASTHKIGIYLWIWTLLFVLSFFSYMVDWYQFQGMLRWSLILFFMFLKAGLIMAFFMHLFWERYALVNVLLWPMTAIACFIFLMAAEFQYTLFSRLFYFVVGGGA